MKPTMLWNGFSMTDSAGQPFRRAGPVLVAAVAAVVMGCQHRVTVDPIRVEPLYVTLDITLRVDRELDDFFDFEEAAPTPPDGGPPEETDQGAPS